MARTNDGFDLQLAEKVNARKKSTLGKSQRSEKVNARKKSTLGKSRRCDLGWRSASALRSRHRSESGFSRCGDNSRAGMTALRHPYLDHHRQGIDVPVAEC